MICCCGSHGTASLRAGQIGEAGESKRKSEEKTGSIVLAGPHRNENPRHVIGNELLPWNNLDN